MHNKILTLIFTLFFSTLFITTNAQNIPIGTWKDLFPYNDAVSITRGQDIIYCATNSAIFTYDENDYSVTRLSLVNGLSEIGISKIKFNEKNNRLIIAYINGNIDVIDENNSIINLSFIKNSNIIGDKSINHIYLDNELAYLSTGFGIVVLDTDKLEIKETYLIGNFGAYVKVNSLTIDATNIYAASDQGVYFADKSSANLADFNNWSTIPELGNQAYSNIVNFYDTLLVSSESITYNEDTLYYNPGGVWQKFHPDGKNVESITTTPDELYICYESAVEKYDINLVKLKTIYTYMGQFNYSPKEAITDKKGYVAFADNAVGLVRAKDNWTAEYVTPNNPSSSSAFNIDFIDGNIWFVAGGYNVGNSGPSGLSKFLVSYYANQTWNSFGKNIKNINDEIATDAVCVAINPNNMQNVYFGTWDDGLYEVNNGSITNIYTAQNSALDSTFFGSTKIGGLDYDTDGNLWVTNAFSNTPLHVLTPTNEWYSFSNLGITSTSAFQKFIIDANNYKWLISAKTNKIVVLDDNGTFDNNTDDRVATNTNFPGSNLYAIVEDEDGEIWIGTDEGVAIFYNPSQVFDEDIEAQQIYIQQEGQTQILLETASVTAIAIDGANRKWIGTQNSGVYLMSADGTEQIEHFTRDNSPLFSNTIFDIVVDGKTGEVYFGTEKGLISYKGTATEPQSDFDIFVYPNPVKPDYDGVIAIRGLVKDTDVRITDISGNIVYETTSIGGQAIWNGNDFNGNRVQSGVYMVFNGSPEGTLKAAAKILFIN